MPYTTKTNWIEEISTIITLGKSGVDMVELGRKYGVTRQRIKQVLDRYVPEWKSIYNAQKKQEIDREWLSKWGRKEDTDLYKMQRLKFSRKKANATRIGHSWTVHFGELDWPTHCPILGMELDYFAEVRQENSPSFDRINSSLGYDAGNVQIISWRANRIKNDGTADEHQRMADYLRKSIVQT